MKYLTMKQILAIYDEIVAQTGGTRGIRDIRLLESAVARPQATFEQEDLYPDIFSKAAALGHSIILNHPFIDGNKRTGYMAMRLFLSINGYDVNATLEEKYMFVMEISGKKKKKEAIAQWLKKKIRKI